MTYPGNHSPRWAYPHAMSPRLQLALPWFAAASFSLAPAVVLAEDPPPVEVILGVIGRPEPDWWRQALDGRVAQDFVPVVPDTAPWASLGEPGLPATLELILATPDSATEHRLWELQREDDVDLSPLRWFFDAVARGRAYADLKSREAAMYDEGVHSTVTVPNPEADTDR